MTTEIRTNNTCESRICQGDILRNVEHLESVNHVGEYVEITKFVFPRVIVLTQDCDLEQDHKKRVLQAPKRPTLVSVLVAPLYVAEHVFAGDHLVMLEMPMPAIPKKGSRFEALVQNETPRYHYLNFEKTSRLPPLIIDFKHYVSVSVDNLRTLKPDNFECKVTELYRESISLRFANYLSRIGLPEVVEPQPA
jgi:hypothetical protein